MARFDEDVIFEGNVSFRGDTVAGITRASLAQNDVQEYPLELERWRVFDAYGTPLPGTSASDDLGLYAGAHGTGVPYIATSDVKTLTATRKARITFQLPPEYVAGQRVQIKATGGMLTTTADASATVDFAVFKVGDDTLISGTDLCATPAITINSIASPFSAQTFTITPTTLNPGDTLDILMTVATTDAASGTAVIAAIAKIAVRLDIKG